MGGFRTAHTRTVLICEYPPPPPGLCTLLLSLFVTAMECLVKAAKQVYNSTLIALMLKHGFVLVKTAVNSVQHRFLCNNIKCKYV